ncbi:CoA transferase [Mesobacillus zeae]|uniref:CoA transferase n=2 Tax=Mesobacillus zeae TaxID=1917180 RepID=A0A398B3B9_9BACI|nr:CoA transferase [Mesobacillus zeae]
MRQTEPLPSSGGAQPLLENIRVIDFTQYLPGPFATLRLAELGAEVIKIEPPDGDPARHTGVDNESDSPVFLAHNRGKKSVVLNLKTSEGRLAALELVRSADAIVESFRPGVMEKLGLGYEEAMQANAKIVYISITGYGDKSPLAYFGSHDINYMALSGALAQLKDSAGRPIHPTNTFADFFGGIAASERLLAGLVSMQHTGKGSYHVISLAETMVSLMGNHVMIEKLNGGQNGVEILNGTIVSYHLYETKDGRHISMGALEPKFWKNFCHAAGRDEWVSAHFSKAVPDNPIYLQIIELFKSRTLREWTEFGHSVDCCLVPVLDAGELADFPLFKNKGIVHDSTGGLRQVKMHGDVNQPDEAHPPEKGSSTSDVLKEMIQDYRIKAGSASSNS